jgi:hypothetical protein
LFHIDVVQQQIKKWHVQIINHRNFKEGDWELLYNSSFKYFKRKLKTRWLGPYNIEKCYDNGLVKRRTIDNEGIPLLVNGFRLQIYKINLSKKDFIATWRTSPLSTHPTDPRLSKKKREKIRRKKTKTSLGENFHEASRTYLWLKKSMEVASYLNKEKKPSS